MSERLDYKGPERPSAAKREDDDVHLLDLLITLCRHKTLVFGTTIVVGILVMAISLLMPPIFTSTAKILPPQQNSSGNAAALLGQLGGLAGMAGLGGVKTPSDLYIGILESRTVADALISRYKLQERYGTETVDEARENLAKLSKIASGKKDGLIEVIVSDKDPKFAAELANAYVEELTKLTQTIAISEASQRRLFFEKQLKDTKDLLANAEIALRTTQEKTGMILPEGQVQAIIARIAQLKATIAAKEVQIQSMRTFATAQNPDLQRVQEELRGLRDQMATLEKSQPNKQGDFMVPTGNLPGVGVEYVRRLRDLKYYEVLFEMLAKQFEIAKIDEARDSSAIQVLDKAVPAERKSKPKHGLTTLVGVIVGAVLGVVLAFLREEYVRSRQNPANDVRWRELSSALSR